MYWCFGFFSQRIHTETDVTVFIEIILFSSQQAKLSIDAIFDIDQ